VLPVLSNQPLVGGDDEDDDDDDDDEPVDAEGTKLYFVWNSQSSTARVHTFMGNVIYLHYNLHIIWLP